MGEVSGEASSRADITLPGRQRELLEMLMHTGKPVVLVLMNGRPLALQWEDLYVPVIVEGWHLGIEMGHAVARVLSGEKNPEGKLSSSFPYVTGQCPVYYNHMNTGRPGSKSKFTSRYLDAPLGSLYPFGYGLSYTEYSYSDFKVEEKDLTEQAEAFARYQYAMYGIGNVPDEMVKEMAVNMLQDQKQVDRLFEQVEDRMVLDKIRETITLKPTKISAAKFREL